MEIVPALRAALADKVGKERFELWFGSGARLEWDGAALLLGMPNRLFLDWIRLNFRRQIEAACQETLGKCPAIKFHIDGAADGRPEMSSANRVPQSGGETPRPAATAAGAPAATAAGAPAATAAGAPAATAAGAPAASGANGNGSISAPFGAGPRRRQFSSLGSFVTGPSNRLAMVSAEMVAHNPGQVTPLLVYGPTAVGKTHLLEGIWTAAQKTCRGGTVVLLSAEQFTSQFLEALRGSGLPNFRRKYRGVACLLLDDLHFLAGKRATQVELLHTMDTLLGEGRQLVFSADRAPVELTDFAPELLTRLAAGMVCRIDPPDYATRLGIVAQQARRLDVELPGDVQRFIASRLTGNARELSGAICCLRATSQALRQKITLPLAEEALSEMIHHHRRVVRLGDIQKAVCHVFGLEAASLQSCGKGKRLSHPRMLAMWLARKHTRAALSEIGQFFGRRSHSTVISAQKRVDQWMAAGTALCLAERTWEIDEAVRQVERQLLAG
jgi:chromosomal replication initiator protein